MESLRRSCALVPRGQYGDARPRQARRRAVPLDVRDSVSIGPYDRPANRLRARRLVGQDPARVARQRLEGQATWARRNLSRRGG
jgi:hypothetical protein